MYATPSRVAGTASLSLQSLCPWNLPGCMKYLLMVIVYNINIKAMLDSHVPNTGVAAIPSLCPSGVYHEEKLTLVRLSRRKKKCEGGHRGP